MRTAGFSFLEASAPVAAHRLLGCLLSDGEVILRITETEAYTWPGDSACHARSGRTARNAPMWADPGHAYVYLCYGVHHLLNVVCAPAGTAAAVLVRAAEPVEGAGTILRRRRRDRVEPQLLAGPGKVAQALGITTDDSGSLLLGGGRVQLRLGPTPRATLAGPRVGIGYALPRDQARPWRFAEAQCAWVSHPSTLAPWTAGQPTLEG